MQPPGGPVLALLQGLLFFNSTGPGLFLSCFEQISLGWQVTASRQPLSQARTNLVMGAMHGDIYCIPWGSQHRAPERREGAIPGEQQLGRPGWFWSWGAWGHLTSWLPATEIPDSAILPALAITQQVSWVRGYILPEHRGLGLALGRDMAASLGGNLESRFRLP